MSTARLFTAAGVVAIVLAACGGQTTSPGGSSSGSGSGGSGSGSGGSSGASSGSGSGSTSSGSGSGSSSGSTSSSGGPGSSGGFGCTFTSTTYPVDPTLCQPQLSRTQSCDGGQSICSYEIEIPCFPDGGSPASVDAGLDNCTAWCKAAAPPTSNPDIGFCQLEAADGGFGVILHAQCGGCGI
jgi:hypothetical protein